MYACYFSNIPCPAGSAPDFLPPHVICTSCSGQLAVHPRISLVNFLRQGLYILGNILPSIARFISRQDSVRMKKGIRAGGERVGGEGGDKRDSMREEQMRGVRDERSIQFAEYISTKNVTPGQTTGLLFDRTARFNRNFARVIIASKNFKAFYVNPKRMSDNVFFSYIYQAPSRYKARCLLTVQRRKLLLTMTLRSEAILLTIIGSTACD